jgi:hypothetical protein
MRHKQMQNIIVSISITSKPSTKNNTILAFQQHCRFWNHKFKFLTQKGNRDKMYEWNKSSVSWQQQP